MKALTYNVTLWLPLMMFVIWATLTIIRDKTFASQIHGLQPSTGANLPDFSNACVAAGKAFYETDGRFSIFKYLNATWKHKAMLYKALSLCLLLDSIQHDDGSNASGQQFDNLAIDLLASFVIAFIGALIFDFLFFKFIFKKRLAKSKSVSRMFIASIVTWTVLVIVGALTIAAIVFALGEKMTESGLGRPMEYLFGQIFSPASFLSVVYVFGVLQTKIALIPAVLLLLLSSFSFALSAIAYIAVHYALKSEPLRNALLKATAETHKAEGAIKSKALLALDYVQKAYWILLLPAIVIKLLNP